MRRTKIVCTIGPACADKEQIEALLAAGMDVARLNFSHGTHEWHGDRVRLLRTAARACGRPVAILQDLSGPKLRLGELPAGGVELTDGGEVQFSERDYSAARPDALPLPIPAVLQGLAPGHPVFLDDGLIELQVIDRRSESGHAAPTVRCRVVHGGRLISRKGIAAPSSQIELPSLTEKDLADFRFGLELDVDWVAVSFVRKPSDLDALREIAASAGSDVPIIAKIERPEAVEAIDGILEATQGIMVARGDLGVEIPLHRVPLVQKDLIRRSNGVGKPVITATQMLESMTDSLRPTRAEVSDVANAILDGTSAVMLSGETATGLHPVETVEMMARIAEHVDANLDYTSLLQGSIHQRAGSITDAISQGVAEIAHDLGAAAILCSTTSGYTARMLARMKPRMPIIAATGNPQTYRRLPLVWGVRPLLVEPTTNTDEMLASTVYGALTAGWIQKGDLVVLALGSPIGRPGQTNLIKVQRA